MRSLSLSAPLLPLPHSISTLRHLTQLTLNCCVEKASPLLAHLDQLRELTLTTYTLSPEDFSWLLSLTNLKSLHVSEFVNRMRLKELHAELLPSCCISITSTDYGLSGASLPSLPALAGYESPVIS